MIKTIEINQGKDVWARGRNGVFKPRRAIVMNQDAGYVVIDVESRRTDGASPITLSMDKHDAEKLACAILGIEPDTYHRVKVPEGEKVALAVWCVEDVYQKAREMGKCVTLEQANNVLMNIEDNQDCNYGVTWDTLENEINYLEDDIQDCIHNENEHEVYCDQCEKFKSKEGENVEAEAVRN